MTEPARVRVAVATDAPAVVALLAGFRDHLGRERPDDEQLRASVERLLAADDCEYLLASDDTGAPGGICQLRFRYGVWYGAYDCWLEDLFVRERSRGHGLGAALVEAALARARARGCARVELDTEASNEAALALYRRFGFDAESEAGDARLFMRLLLPSTRHDGAVQDGSTG